MKAMWGARCALLLLICAATATAGTFVNGNFETGDASGWTVGGGPRASINNAALNPADFLPGGARYNAGIATGHSKP
jgi:hypothetical protein